MDPSNGYEAVSQEFLTRRGGSRARSTAIGVKEVRKWATTLPRGGSVIDLGCGPGFPITVVLVEEGLQLFGVDAAPSLVAAFRHNLPGTPVVCESVLESRLFDRTFDAVLSIGLMFLLKPEEQHRLIQRFLLGAVGISVTEECEDVGQNHYFDCVADRVIIEAPGTR